MFFLLLEDKKLDMFFRMLKFSHDKASEAYPFFKAVSF